MTKMKKAKQDTFDRILSKIEKSYKTQDDAIKKRKKVSLSSFKDGYYWVFYDPAVSGFSGPDLCFVMVLRSSLNPPRLSITEEKYGTITPYVVERIRNTAKTANANPCLIIKDGGLAVESFTLPKSMSPVPVVDKRLDGRKNKSPRKTNKPRGSKRMASTKRSRGSGTRRASL